MGEQPITGRRRNDHFRVAGAGVAFGSYRVDNAELATQLGVTTEWIESRCGVHSRFRAAADEPTSALAVRACAQAIATADDHLLPDLVLCATFTPDFPLCPTAPAIAAALNLPHVGAFDLNAASSGGTVALGTAVSFMQSGMAQSVLLVASDTPTKFLSAADAGTRIVMSDGAAALLLTHDDAHSELLAFVAGSDGSGARYFSVPGGGSVLPAAASEFDAGSATLRMEGTAIYKFAVSRAPQLIKRVCQTGGISEHDLSWVVMHQPNMRMIEAIQKKVPQIAPEKWLTNVARVGNTMSATVLVLLAEAFQQQRFRRGDLVLVLGFGAGLTWSAMLVRW